MKMVIDNKNNLIIFLIVGSINISYLLPVLGIEKNLSIITTFFLIGVFVLNMLLKNNKVVINEDVFVIFAFSIWLLLNLTRSLAPNYGTKKTILFIFSNFIYFIIPFVINFDLKKLSKFYNYLLYINFLIIFLMVLYNKNNLSLITINSRISLFNINPIWLARILGQTVIILFFLKVKINKYIKVLIIGFILILMIFTGSKGPVLSLFVSIFLILVRTTKKLLTLNNIMKFIIFITILFLFINYIVLMIFPNNYLIQRFLRISPENSVSLTRMDYFSIAIKNFIKKPLIGFGTGSYGFLFAHKDVRSYPHNIILEIMVELGMIGLILITPLFLNSLIKINNILKIYSRNDTLKATYCLYIFYLINSMFTGDIILNLNLFLYLGISSVINTKLLKERYYEDILFNI